VNEIELFQRFALMSAVVAGAGSCGLGLLLFAPRGWLGRTVLTAAGLAVSSGLVGLLTPQFLGWVAGGGAAVAVASVLASTRAVREFAVRYARPLCRPRAVGLVALCVAGGVWGHEAWHYESALVRLTDETLAQAVELPPTPTVHVGTAFTDGGAAVELHSAADPLSAGDIAAVERSSAAVNQWFEHIIRRGAASDECNCHGWVFTGGKYHVLGRHVPAILTDNGYRPASTPAAGDLCVYRNDTDTVTHTAVVRAVADDGTVLVEGKWGRMGIYLHPANKSCYGTEYTFYHTTRSGHLLGGLDCVGVAASSNP